MTVRLAYRNSVETTIYIDAAMSDLSSASRAVEGPLRVVSCRVLDGGNWSILASRAGLIISARQLLHTYIGTGARPSRINNFDLSEAHVEVSDLVLDQPIG